ncbi:hypothetical protein ACQ4LE_002129 [Meloidogyne hapla]
MSDSEIDVVNIDSDTSHPEAGKKCRKSYSIAQKLEAVEFARKHSIHAASHKFKCERASVRKWIRQERDLKMQRNSNNKKRLSGGGRPLLFKEINDKWSEM